MIYLFYFFSIYQLLTNYFQRASVALDRSYILFWLIDYYVRAWIIIVNHNLKMGPKTTLSKAFTDFYFKRYNNYKFLLLSSVFWDVSIIYRLIYMNIQVWINITNICWPRPFESNIYKSFGCSYLIWNSVLVKIIRWYNKYPVLFFLLERWQRKWWRWH